MASASGSPEAVLHLAVLHGLAQAGFPSTSRAASLTFSSAVSRYLRLVALSCADLANLAGRSKIAAIDVVQAVEDLGVGGVADLHEWAASLEKEVVFSGGFEGLEEARGIEKGLVEMRLVHDDEIKLESEEEEESMDVDEEDDGRVKSESPDEIPETAPRKRSASPDLSWLPPLPGTTLQPDVPASTSNGVTSTISAPSLSIAERYRRAIPYAQSQLSQAHPFVDPPHPSTPVFLPPAPSSFPSLLKAYEATASDPSIALRQTPLRQQATELLRRSIATAENFSPPDTLISQIPPPRVTPIVPSHSDVLPQHLIPLNPNPTGMLASLVHQIHSPHLPPTLRDRLTSLRPPQAQLRDSVPILYGEPIRGGDNAALARARGKQPNPEDEAFLRATWDSGPRGIEKWGRSRLPTGRKVVQSGIGEDKPREPEGTAASRIVKLKLGGTEGSVSPGGGLGDVNEGEKPPTPGGLAPSGAMGTGIKLRLGGAQMGRRESEEGVQVSSAPTIGAAGDALTQGAAAIAVIPTSNGPSSISERPEGLPIVTHTA